MAAVIKEYPHGSVVRLWGVFRTPPTDPTSTIPGALVNPVDVDVKYETPDGTITTVASPSNPSTGRFYTDITVNKVGTWRYCFIGDGARQERQLICRASDFSEGA